MDLTDERMPGATVMTIIERTTPEERRRRPPIIIEEVTDPAEIARHQAQDERARRNVRWLQAHGADVLPLARGRHLAVACEEAFIADTAQEAWARARAAHPDDPGALLQYVPLGRGPRIYAGRG
jgi:hypothetical protein